MNTNKFMEGIHIIQNNYHKILSKEELEMYYEGLKDMNGEDYINNIKKHIKTSKYMPNIAEIRNESTRKKYANYDQRDYTEKDFNNLYAN